MAESQVSLLTLPDDVLLHLFKFLNERDLESLCQVDTCLSDFIGATILSKRLRGTPMVGVVDPNAIIHQRINKIYSHYENYCMAKNWRNGRYFESGYAYRSSGFGNCKLHLNSSSLYVSNATVLEKYGRLAPLNRFPRFVTENDALDRQRDVVEFSHDIFDFKMRGDVTFLARMCGRYTLLDDDNMAEMRLHKPQEQVTALGFCKSIYATSSDASVKIWRREDELGLIDLQQMHSFSGQSINTLAFNDSASLLYGGIHRFAALAVIDIETGKFHMMRQGISDIMSIAVKDEHVLLMVNRTGSLLLFDRRSNLLCRSSSGNRDRFVCLDYDGSNGVVCGSINNGDIALYDCRYWQMALNTFHVNCVSQQGPTDILSVVCDNRFCFAAVRQHVHVFDFRLN